jgi:cation transporter-like permease
MYQPGKVLTDIARKRLAAIREFTEFGAGFKLAMRDLELRGAGNILGEAQSGHIESIGYELYCKEIDRAVRMLKGEDVGEARSDITIDLPLHASIPADYIEDESLRLEAYRRISGIMDSDDAMDVIVEETTEDIEKMAGMLPSEKTYLRSNPWDLFKHRIPWLALLMVSATFTGLIITSFENALAAQVVLTAFIPMLMDTGGNSGSQSSVTVIRALSLGEIDFSDLPGVVWKEIRTAVLCGFALSALCFAKIMIFDRLILGNTDITVTMAFVICLAMAITVVIAKVVGSTLPMFAKKIGFDPAVMASPFITTIVDALSLLVYFSIARAILFS